MESASLRIEMPTVRLESQTGAFSWVASLGSPWTLASPVFDSPPLKPVLVEVVPVASEEPTELPRTVVSLERKMQILGAATGISAAAMIAMNFALSPWGWVLFVLSDLIWIAFAFKRRIPGQLVMYTAHMVIASVGIYRSLLPMLMT